MFLGREPRNAAGLVNRRALLQQARETLVKHGLPLDPQRLVSSLPFAYRQLTEIAKALVGNARILVLDEPTSSLTGGEEEVLFAAIKNATERGVGVIYVTHRLAEVFQITDRVTVFRDGQRVVTQDTKATDMAGLVAAIVGPGHERMKRATMAVETGTAVAAPGVGMPDEPPSTGPVMEMVGVSNDRLTDIELTVGAGEIVGLAGNISSGRTEILETLFGLRPAIKGTLRLDGHELTLRRPEDAIRRGIALAPEDRHLSGLVLDHSIEHNVAMPRLPQLTKLGLFQRKAATARAEAAVTELAIKTPTVQTRLRDLSGGNQQKVVFGKWRGPAPRVLLLDEPTVGVDVGAREEIYDVIRRMASQGCAVVVASSDFDELLQLAHRVAIVIDGRITEAMPRTAITSEQHLHHLVQENKS
jgi:ribose transport system ATP-binding protein